MAGDERRGVILVIDDEASICEAMSQILGDEGYRVLSAGSGEDGLAQAVEHGPDAIFLDVWLPGMDGIETLRLLRERGVVAPVIMISGHGTIETAVRATKLGAYDFIEKPVSLDRVLLATGNALRHARLERRNRALRAELRREAEFLGRSPAVERLRSELTAATDGAPVLLYGAKGSGRRLAARWLALHGPRPEGPFLDVQASAMPRERLTRALLGDPGRLGEEPGRIALADEGTLYLENADTLPPTLQSLLLSGYHDAAYAAPGKRHIVRAEFQLVVALLEAPEELVDAGKLSGDFLGMFSHTIAIPSLADRIDDLPDLTERFATEICREYAREEIHFAPEAIDVMLRYAWPGNVRELKRVVERLVLLTPGPLVRPEDLPVHLSGDASADAGVAGTLERFEERWVRRFLDEADGDVERAARRLGLSKESFLERMRRVGIE